MDDLANEIRRRLPEESFGAENKRAFSVPEFTDPMSFDPALQWEDRGSLLKYGIELTGIPGPNSRLVFDKDQQTGISKIRLELFAKADQLVVLAKNQKLISNIRLEGQRQTLLVAEGGDRPFHGESIILRGEDTLIAIGSGVTSNGTKLLIDGHRTWITIGDDCMLSHSIDISATDSHSIFDIDSLEVLNFPGSIIVGHHVWIGAHASILKNVRIGDGSIVGTRALVNTDIPAFSLFAGCPARSIRSGVTWSRQQAPSQTAKSKIVEELVLKQECAVLLEQIPKFES